MVSFLPLKQMPMTAMVFNFSYLAGAHIYRQYTDYLGYTMDFTTSQMMLTLKMVGFAYSYYDAHIDSKKVLPTHLQRSIKELPSLLEFFGFVYFFCGFASGPVFDFIEYRYATEKKIFPSFFSLLLKRKNSVFKIILCIYSYLEH